MTEVEVSFTSLCYIRTDSSANPRLYRLADIDGGRLHTPAKSDRNGNYFENRKYLFNNDGPSAPGTVGVWEWISVQNWKKPDTDYVQSHYSSEYSPIRVVVLTAQSVEEVMEQLKNGTAETQPYTCDAFFCFEQPEGELAGVLCRKNQFTLSGHHAKLLDSVFSLPSYTLAISDVYNWNDQDLRFLKVFQIDTPSVNVLTGSTYEIIQALILKRATWPWFKESIGATKAEWHHSRAILERICGDTLYEAAADVLKSTPEQAKLAVDAFVEHADAFLQAGDIDAEVLTEIVLRHEGLRSACEENITEKWKASHTKEIADAEAEVEQVKNIARREKAAAGQRLREMEKEISAAKEERDRILSEIEASQGKLNHILAEIEKQETLGEETLTAVRRKIAGARDEMAEFIAGLPVMAPQPNPAPVSVQGGAPWHYTGGTGEAYGDTEIKSAESWVQELEAIADNLSFSLRVDPKLSPLLAAFLYSSRFNRMPLLVAGPGGQDIADILSISITGEGAGHLTLGDGPDYEVAAALQNQAEEIVSIRNMFGKGWTGGLPQALCGQEKLMIWTHPYAEDMAIEPKGLYNYMLPVLSECFVGALPAVDIYPGKRDAAFQPYESKRERPLRITAFKRLRLSKLLLDHLTLVLSDAKAMLKKLDTPATDKDMEILFGMLPLCVLTGRTDILREVLETETGVYALVKEEAERYLEDG